MRGLSELCASCPIMALAVLAACTGNIGQDSRSGIPAEGEPGSAGSGGRGPATGGGGGRAGGEVFEMAPRRLTRREYANTIQDLLGVEPPPISGFVAEEKVAWFENDARALTFSPVLAEQVVAASEQVAAAAIRNLDRLAPCSDARNDRACLEGFLRSFGKRAFRRPLTDGELGDLLAVAEAAAAEGGRARGIELALRVILVSPQMLYRFESGVTDARGNRRPTSWEMATRLSYALWAGPPDEMLMDLAERDALTDPRTIADTAVAMLSNAKAARGLRSIMRQWLDTEAIEANEKDQRQYPVWNRGVASAAREEVEWFAVNALLETANPVQALFKGTETRVTASLGQIYGAATWQGSDVRSITLDARQRAGVLTLAGVLAAQSGNMDTAPTLRGAFVRQRILCDELPPPPPNVNNEKPARTPTTTTRDRIAQHASDPACSGCHRRIDPIGFGFERYDAIGRYRETEDGLPIDDSGEVVESDIGVFHGPVDLADKLAASPKVSGCLARQIVTHTYGRQLDRNDDALVDALAARLQGQDGYKALVRDLVMSPAFQFIVYRP